MIVQIGIESKKEDAVLDREKEVEYIGEASGSKDSEQILKDW